MTHRSEKLKNQPQTQTIKASAAPRMGQGKKKAGAFQRWKKSLRDTYKRQGRYRTGRATAY